MEGVNGSISTCRHCHFYQLEGRRGGYCQQLSVPVQGNWKVCSLALSPFANWEKLVGISTEASAPALPTRTAIHADLLDVLAETLAETELSPELARSAVQNLESAFESVRDPL